MSQPLTEGGALQFRSWLARPRQSWRAVDDLQKFALFTRLSTHFLLLFLTGLFVWIILFGPVGRSPQVPVPERILAHAGLAPKTTAAVLSMLGLIPVLFVVELAPQLNVRSRRDVAPFLRTALLFNSVLWYVSVALYWSASTWQWSYAGIMVNFVAGMMLSWGVFPWLAKRWLWALALAVVSYAIFHDEIGLAVVYFPFLGVGIMASTLWMMQVLKDLRRAKMTEAALQVAEERLRFSQELHDTLGQHLAAISLKVQLAQALAQRGDARLTEELEALGVLASRSSADMRQVVRGYRQINLAAELQGARQLFEAAGIRMTVHGVSTDVPENFRELAAWLLREATTNILRHSSATAATVDLSARSIRIQNDGASDATGKLGGLGALQHRAARLGAQILIKPPAQGQGVFTIDCHFRESAGGRTSADPLGDTSTGPRLTDREEGERR